MLKWIDNFEGYAVPGIEPIGLSNYITRNYLVHGTNATNPLFSNRSLTSVPETRVVVASSGSYTSGSGGTFQLVKMLEFDTPSVYLGQRIVNYPDFVGAVDATTGQFGLVAFESGVYKGVLIKIGFHARNTMTVCYNDGGTVQVDTVTLLQPLFGNSDYLEVQIDKSDGSLNIWINNRVVYSEQVVPSTAYDLGWVVTGVVSSSADGAAVANSLVKAEAAPSWPGSYVGGFGVTDFYVVDETAGVNTDKLGRVRVTGRPAAGDGGPNEWSPYPGATEPTHAAIVATLPIDPGKYLTSTAESQTELFVGSAFPSLGSEAVVGMMVRTLGAKTDPLGSDLKNTIRAGSTIDHGPVQTLSTTPSYVNTVFETNPATSSPWLAAEANNSNFGFTSETE